MTSPIEHLKDPFLAEYKKSRFINVAAKAVGINHETVTNWKKNDPKFMAKFLTIDLSVNQSLDGDLEESAMRRGISGSPVYAVKDGQNIIQRGEDGKPMLDNNGKPVPVILRREYETGLTVFLLKTRMGDKYIETIRQEIDVKIIAQLSSEFLAVIRKHVPDFCPHCKSSLAIQPRIAKELETLSAKLNRS
jgi:hypothetical protein